MAANSVAPASPSPTCPKCGTPAPPGARFCNTCGSSLIVTPDGSSTGTQGAPPPSGAAMHRGAAIIPPAALRMSWRSFMVLSTGPLLRALWLRPR